ncbi:MAG: hypothetical protein ACKOW3_09350 [Hyphomicrobium sp.]
MTNLTSHILWLSLFISNASMVLSDEIEGSPERLNCTFGNGVLISYADGKFIEEPAKELSFAFLKIDLDGQKAELEKKSDQKSQTVRIVRALNANHFLEVVNEGFLNLTTIYDKDLTLELYPAVHSRHLGLLGQPVYGHYTGTCKEN